MKTDTHGMTARGRIVLGACLAVGAGLFLLACDNSSDPVAPNESTITVSANPQTVLIGEPSTITATLRSKTGTRLPDQEIAFSTDAGILDPPDGTFLITDSQGQAFSTLATDRTATVTARSGSIEGSTQVQTSSCSISTVGITVNPNFIEACDNTGKVNVKATVLDTAGDPCVAVLVKFSNPNSTVTGRFDPSQKTTNALGEVDSVWTVNSTQCQQQCGSTPSDPNTGNCTIFIAASVGSVMSPAERITDNVP